MLWLISLMSVLLRSRPFGGSERAVVLAISFVISPTEGLFTLRSFQLNDFFFFFQAEDGIRDIGVTGVQTCALPIYRRRRRRARPGLAVPQALGVEPVRGAGPARPPVPQRRHLLHRLAVQALHDQPEQRGVPVEVVRRPPAELPDRPQGDRRQPAHPAAARPRRPGAVPVVGADPGEPL